MPRKLPEAFLMQAIKRVLYSVVKDLPPDSKAQMEGLIQDEGWKDIVDGNLSVNENIENVLDFFGLSGIEREKTRVKIGVASKAEEDLVQNLEYAAYVIGQADWLSPEDRERTLIAIDTAQKKLKEGRKKAPAVRTRIVKEVVTQIGPDVEKLFQQVKPPKYRVGERIVHSRFGRSEIMDERLTRAGWLYTIKGPVTGFSPKGEYEVSESEITSAPPTPTIPAPAIPPPRVPIPTAPPMEEFGITKEEFDMLMDSLRDSLRDLPVDLVSAAVLDFALEVRATDRIPRKRALEEARSLLEDAIRRARQEAAINHEKIKRVRPEEIIERAIEKVGLEITRTPWVYIPKFDTAYSSKYVKQWPTTSLVKEWFTATTVEEAQMYIAQVKPRLGRIAGWEYSKTRGVYVVGEFTDPKESYGFD